jgi:hypothetical protein
MVKVNKHQIHFDQSCLKCQAPFVLFKNYQQCPNCSAINMNEKKTATLFSKVAVDTLRLHKRMYGKFTPISWENDSLTDKMLELCFYVFDQLEKDKAGSPKLFIQLFFDSIKWHDKQYLRLHAREIVFHIHDVYLNRSIIYSIWNRVSCLWSTKS